MDYLNLMAVGYSYYWITTGYGLMGISSHLAGNHGNNQIFFVRITANFKPKICTKTKANMAFESCSRSYSNTSLPIFS
jgi:hypothetical protein